MAGIEPLGTIMTYAAQPTQVAAPSASVASVPESMEGQNMDASVARVDQETLAVTKLAEDESSSDQENNQGYRGNNNEVMRQALEELNKKATSVTSEFGIHEKTNRITIKIVDKKTKEVVKELPPEKMLDMIAKIWETSGLLVDEKR